MHKALGWIPNTAIKLCVVVRVCSPNPREAETGGSEVQENPWQLTEFKPSIHENLTKNKSREDILQGLAR